MNPKSAKWWLEYYPPGVPHEVDTTEFATLRDMIDTAFATFAARPMVTCLDKTLTFGEVDQLSHALAAWLQSTGLKPGARVALMMPNCHQYVIALVALVRAGLVVVNVNPLYTARELQHQLSDSGAEAIIILEQFAHTLAGIIGNTSVKYVVTTGIGDLLGFPKAQFARFVTRHVKKTVPAFSLPQSINFNAALSRGRTLATAPVTLAPSDMAYLQYTGGTTGASKGAILSHANVISQTLIAEAWLSPALIDPRRGAAPEIYTVICALPLYHIYALTACFWLGIRIGAHNVLIPNPRDMDAMVATMAKQPFHVLPAVNTMFNALLHHAQFQKLDFSALRISSGGGAAVQRAVADGWLKLTGTPIVEGYGLTESTAGATCNEFTNEIYTGDVGMPIPNVEIVIRDDNNIELPLGQPGEVCVRGPNVMQGYWQAPAETAKAIAADGFLRTGDIGIMLPNGHLKIVDRKKDMILVSGFNVYPTEIEEVVMTCPGVMECGAVGIADEKTGEAVRLAVVRSDPTLTEALIMEHCRKNLTAYKCPKTIVFRDSLPKSPIGKILRRELRDQI